MGLVPTKGQLSYLYGMELINPLAQAYAERYSSRPDALLEEIAAYTATHHPEAHMLSGPLQGKLLEMVSRLMAPRRVLEIGTFMGYSALCLAAGLADEGRLHTIELREEDADRASAYFTRANRRDQIILHRGNALAIIPTLDEVWDLVFIDADKAGYVDYYRLVMPRVRPGGLVIADNVFFHGGVLEDVVTGKSARGVQAFNDLVAADSGVERVMLTVRDGLFFIRKR
jgi:caffeoyl-CoA O-methyltransferase